MGIAVLLVLAMATCSVMVEGGTWCVGKSNVDQKALQKSLDYACGAGADCRPIVSSGACYNPDTVLAHASYAMNSYFQKLGQAQGACDFSGTATLTTTDPSYGSCVYPSSSSAAGTPLTPTTTTTTSGNTPTTTTTTSGNTPTTTIPGLGPSSNINDFNSAVAGCTFDLSLLLTSLLFLVSALLF
ncbi:PLASMODESMATA CALLOSE-BINDING PROTEIN 3-like [Nymphaea colorata]|nr:PLASMODESMATA CALLOSE-BINDING PROTEIN 3-like [Nymphaea colorata]